MGSLHGNTATDSLPSITLRKYIVKKGRSSPASEGRSISALHHVDFEFKLFKGHSMESGRSKVRK